MINMLSNFFAHHAKRVWCIDDQHAVKLNFFADHAKRVCCIDDQHAVKLNFFADHAKRVWCIDDQHAVKLNFFADHAKRVWCIDDQHAVKFLCTSCLKGMVYRWSTCCQLSLYIMLKGYGVSMINSRCQISLYIMLKGYGVSMINMLSNFFVHHAKRVWCIDDKHAVKLNFFAHHAKRVWCIYQRVVKFLFLWGTLSLVVMDRWSLNPLCPGIA